MKYTDNCPACEERGNECSWCEQERVGNKLEDCDHAKCKETTKLHLQAEIDRLKNKLRKLEPQADDPLTSREIEDFFTNENALWDESDNTVTRRLWNMYAKMLESDASKVVEKVAQKLFVPPDFALKDDVLVQHLEEVLRERDEYKNSEAEAWAEVARLEKERDDQLKKELESSTGPAINDFSDLCYQRACEKGWHDDDDKMSEKEQVASYFMNLHSEISEAWEAFRAGKHNELCDKAEKMKELGLDPLTCFEEEFADLVIRAAEDAKALKIDLWRALRSKLAYNQSRAYRHGGKRA